MKNWIALLLALALVLSMTACGRDESPTPTGTEPPATTEPTEEKETPPVTAPTLTGDDPEAQIEAEVEAVLAGLTAEYESIIEGVDSYDAYMAKQAEIVAFYEKVNATSADLCIKMCGYAITYAENILASGKSTDEMYDDMEIIYDLVYDDMGDEIYDGIYDGILDDIYDDFYDGALDDQPDDVEYSDWSDARSNEYEMWSDTRSEVYEQWSDMRSDVYEFWSDMRSELWSDELDGAKEELEDFREDVEKMLGKEPAEAVPAETTVPPTEPAEPSQPAAETADGIRPEFKEAMDSYEVFFDDYAKFMKAYMDSDNPLSMMSEYSAMMQQYSDTMDKLQDIDEGTLSDEEAKYYAEAMLRINQKLLDAL